LAIVDQDLRDFVSDPAQINVGGEKRSGAFHRLHKANPALFDHDREYTDRGPRVRGVVAAHQIGLFLDELAHPDEYERDDHGHGEVLMRAPSTETVLARLGEHDVTTAEAIDLGYAVFTGESKVFANREFASFMDGFVIYFETAAKITA
jgi:hypothetical protein